MQCFTGLHLWLVLLFGLPGVVFFALGVPCGSALFLRIKRRLLEADWFSVKYGFLYEGEEEATRGGPL